MNRVIPLIVNEYKISADTVGGIVTLIIISGGTLEMKRHFIIKLLRQYRQSEHKG
ncbi:hypothetical protein [Peribacillus butanolivorans]|uniref:hypothetical protein n=1 Tax=Peribacillus butanolivorans TaxID=421767 RepID=UPI003647AE22